MSADLLSDIVEQAKATARLEAELGHIARDLALLAAQVADLKRSWPQDPAVFTIEDSHQVN